MGQQLQRETLNPCTATVVPGTRGTPRLAAPRKESEGKRGLPQPVLLWCPLSSRSRMERRGAERRAGCRGARGARGAREAPTRIFWGTPPTPTPGTWQRPSAQDPPRPRGAERRDPALQTPGLPHQTKSASRANLTCFLAQIRFKHFLRVCGGEGDD